MIINKNIYIILFAAVATMACAFVQNIVFPPSPTPEAIPSPQPQGSPTTFSQIPTLISDPISIVEPIHCSDDSCLQACLSRLDEVLETKPFDSIGNSIYEEQAANFNLVIYMVDGDEITEPAVLYVPPDYHKYQEDTASHQRIWDFYVAIIPPELRKWINEFVIFTDGSGGDAGAWVSPSATDINYWQVGFDLLDSDYPPFLAEALVHETGHLLTLNTSQVPYDGDIYYYYDEKRDMVQGCDQYAVDGGCSLPDSYINLFYQRFWRDTYAEWWAVKKEAQDTESFEEYLQIMEQFYDNHSDLFLNSYAATNVEEDTAESFAFFVLNPRPTGNSIPEQKVSFYYEFPELVDARQQIIEGLCSYIQ
jgi:hypothetical protein